MRSCIGGLVGLAALASACSNQSGNSVGAKTDPVGASSDLEKSNISYDGPFGLKMGQPLAELQFAEGEDDPSQARLLESVPKPMAEIEKYAVVAYPDVGVCEIRSISRTFDSDAYGNNIRPAIDELASLLDAKYGAHRKMDACGSYSCEFFQMNLKNGSQVYAYEWSKKTGARLPENISEVTLGAMPGEFNDTFFRLDYVSSHADQCRRAKEKLKSASL